MRTLNRLFPILIVFGILVFFGWDTIKEYIANSNPPIQETIDEQVDGYWRCITSPHVGHIGKWQHESGFIWTKIGHDNTTGRGSKWDIISRDPVTFKSVNGHTVSIDRVVATNKLKDGRILQYEKLREGLEESKYRAESLAYSLQKKFPKNFTMRSTGRINGKSFRFEHIVAKLSKSGLFTCKYLQSSNRWQGWTGKFSMHIEDAKGNVLAEVHSPKTGVNGKSERNCSYSFNLKNQTQPKLSDKDFQTLLLSAHKIRFFSAERHGTGFNRVNVILKNIRKAAKEIEKIGGSIATTYGYFKGAKIPPKSGKQIAAMLETKKNIATSRNMIADSNYEYLIAPIGKTIKDSNNITITCDQYEKINLKEFTGLYVGICDYDHEYAIVETDKSNNNDKCNKKFDYYLIKDRLYEDDWADVCDPATVDRNKVRRFKRIEY